MALNTDLALQRQVIYSVYVRAHTPEGTFRAVIPDLDRIQALGVDILWFLPLHPIGVKGKKGSLGCPYANRDYRDVNPAYGTLEDFRALCDEIHRRGMKVMIDVVYNHTSPDSVLWEMHPEFFYHGPDGKPGNKIGDWSDVIDLDYNVPALWDYQIESLCRWAELVDGFRCDVASFVPLAFWERARAAVERIRPGCIWLAETVHRSFGNYVRSLGYRSERDTDMYAAFDMEYEYDIRETLDRYLQGKTNLSHYLDDMVFQEAVYPANYNKLRFLENHDQPRISSYIRRESDLINWTAFLYFQKGTTLLYAGQEFEDDHLPSLFEREPIQRETGRDLSSLLRKLAELKREILDPDDHFFAAADDQRHIVTARRHNARADKYGVFSLRSASAEVPVEAPDGNYVNLIDGSPVSVRKGTLRCKGKPILFCVENRP